MGLCASTPAKSDRINPACVDLSHFHVRQLVGMGSLGKVFVITRRRKDDELIEQSENKNVNVMDEKDQEMYALKRVSKSEVVYRRCADMV